MSNPRAKLSKGLMRRLVGDMRSKGVHLVFRYGDSTRLYAILKGPGGSHGATAALTLLSPYFPRAIIHKGGVTPSGGFEVAVWVDPDETTYQRRIAQEEAELGPVVKAGLLGVGEA